MNMYGRIRKTKKIPFFSHPFLRLLLLFMPVIYVKCCNLFHKFKWILSSCACVCLYDWTSMKKVFSIKRRLALIWPKTPYICKTHSDHAHLHNAKIDLDRLSLLDFHSLILLSIQRSCRRRRRLHHSSSYYVFSSQLNSFEICVFVRIIFCYQKFSTNSIRSFDLFNRCSLYCVMLLLLLLLQLRCELCKTRSVYNIWLSKFIHISKSSSSSIRSISIILEKGKTRFLTSFLLSSATVELSQQDDDSKGVEREWWAKEIQQKVCVYPHIWHSGVLLLFLLNI